MDIWFYLFIYLFIYLCKILLYFNIYLTKIIITTITFNYLLINIPLFRIGLQNTFFSEKKLNIGKPDRKSFIFLLVSNSVLAIWHIAFFILYGVFYDDVVATNELHGDYSVCFIIICTIVVLFVVLVCHYLFVVVVVLFICCRCR